MTYDQSERLWRWIIGLLFLAMLGSCVAMGIEDDRNIRYESVAGSVTAVDVFGVTSNSWNGTHGNCRVTVQTADGQRTIAPYWRDCAKVSAGDHIIATRRTDDSIGGALNGDWKW